MCYICFLNGHQYIRVELRRLSSCLSYPSYEYAWVILRLELDDGVGSCELNWGFKHFAEKSRKMANSYISFRINSSTHIIPEHTSKPDHSYSVETRPKGKLPRVNAQSGVILEKPSNYQMQFSVCNTNFLNSSDSCAIRTGDSVILYNAMQDTEATAPESYRSIGRQCGAQTSAKPNPSPSPTLLLRTAG